MENSCSPPLKTNWSCACVWRIAIASFKKSVRSPLPPPFSYVTFNKTSRPESRRSRPCPPVLVVSVVSLSVESLFGWERVAEIRPFPLRTTRTGSSDFTTRVRVRCVCVCVCCVAVCCTLDFITKVNPSAKQIADVGISVPRQNQQPAVCSLARSEEARAQRSARTTT